MSPQRRLYLQKHYREHKAYYIANPMATYRARRAWIISLKEIPCTDCHTIYPHYIMEFDHRPGVKKLFNVSQFQGHSRQEIIDELAKCDVVCANCHKIRTYNRQVAI